MSTAVHQSLDLHHAIGLGDAAMLLACTLGRTPTHETVRRWIVHGLVIQGQRVFLRAERVNGYWLTCPEWVAEFARARQ